MRHIKTYEKFAGIFESSEEDIKEYLDDISLELSDIGFSVEVTEPNLKNMCRYNISIIKNPGDSALQFKLGDIKDVVCRIKDYMSVNKYFVEEVDVSGPTFKEFRKIEGDFKDPYNWNDDVLLVMINIYFDRDL